MDNAIPSQSQLNLIQHNSMTEGYRSAQPKPAEACSEHFNACTCPIKDQLKVADVV